MMTKRTRTKRADTAARVGANRQKRLNEQRAQRPCAVLGAVKRLSKFSVIITLAAAVGYAVFAYGPMVSSNITDAAKSNKRLPVNFSVVGDKVASARLSDALETLLAADPLGFDRTQALNVAASIPEIEKISVRKIKDKKSRNVSTLIKVTERKPVALVHCGEFSLIDKKGIRFSPKQGQYYELPLLVIGEKAMAGDTISMDVFNQIKKTSRNIGGTFFQQISQIDISEDASLRLRFKSGEAEYIIGYGDIEERLIHVMRLRERLLENIDEPARIDLRYRCLAFASSL